jgi:histidine triad (HIT) family protein
MKQAFRGETKSHCTFCDLIHGAAEVSVCHEDSDAIAFMDIQPVNNGHVLVVPRQHYESLSDVPEEIGMHLFKVTMRLANAVRKVAGTDDLNIVVNSGAAAGQDEPHYHVHIIPRRHGDGFDIPLPFNGSEMPDRTVLDAYAARIISALRDPMRADSHSPLGGPSGLRVREERSIVVPVFADSARKATDHRPATPDVGEYAPDVDLSAEREGAHGELLLWDRPSSPADAL